MCELLIKDYEYARLENYNVEPELIGQGIAKLTATDGFMSTMVKATEPLYPNRTSVGVLFPQLVIGSGVAETEFLFRVYDEQFAYPAKDWGTIRFRPGVIKRVRMLEDGSITSIC